MNNIPVTVIVPMRNASSTIISMLISVVKQTYPINEIIIVDNASSDDSVEAVRKYKKAHKRVPIKLVLNKNNIGVGGSYDAAVKITRTEIFIFMHSDSSLPSKFEITKLVEPILKDKKIVATYSSILHPKNIWLKYNFWMKCLLVRGVGKESPGMNGKFDCIRKSAYKKIGGFDVKNYGQHIGIGSDDADFHIRLKKIGQVIPSNAKVVHLHYLDNDYSLSNYITHRKLLARSYGRLLRQHMRELSPFALTFLIKPLLTFQSIIPILFPFNWIIMFIFSLWYMSGMYITPSNYKDFKIFLLPFLTIFLIFYETYWTTESFLHLKTSKRAIN
jgi:glycosyltransferase involved in cell wall biosynthesis